MREGERDRAREVDRLAFEVAEIDRVDPRPGEEQEIAAEADRLEHAETLRLAAAAAADALSGDGGARDALGAAVQALRPAAGHDPDLETHLRRAESLLADAQELAIELASYGDRIDDDPQRLDQLRERRADLATLARKYGAEMLAYAETARGRLQARAAATPARRARRRGRPPRAGRPRPRRRPHGQPPRRRGRPGARRPRPPR